MRKRNHVIPVRLNAKELRFLEEQVEKSGLSREEYIRSIVMGGEVRARPCEHHAELLRKISGLCNNANQLAHVANGCGMAGEESIREMLRMTKETWRLVNHPEKEFSEPENFIPVQEEGEENLSGSSLHSRNISTGQEKGTDAGQREQERPSVRRELENIKREKAEKSQKRSREKNRGPRKTQKKARKKRKVKAR